MPADTINFDLEWLHLPKEEFRLLVMIADIGSDIGCLNDACRYFSISTQTANKNRIRDGLRSLNEKGIISLSQHGRSYSCPLSKPIAEENKIAIEREYVVEIKKRKYGRSVAWENVLKVYIWLLNKGCKKFTNREIEEDIGVSESTISTAKSVLQDFGAIKIEYLTLRQGDRYYRIGQEALISAWWENE